MQRPPGGVLLTLLAGLLYFSPVSAAQMNGASSTVQLAADEIDWIIGSVQRSTEALAYEYERLYHSSDATPVDKSGWTKHLVRREHTTQFNSWGGGATSPAYQSPNPAYYAYGDGELTDSHFHELGIFERLTPVLRATYNTFDFSWTYLTTADDMMLLYPFLSLEEAVNNYPPTQQVFYTTADFTHHKAGWTRPYLDLAGAGMMVTVSVPAYDNDNVIGVASHDITLDQLSSRLLRSLATDTGDTAYLIDSDGLVIGVSDATLAKELQQINQAAGEAVLHYRERFKGKTLSKTRWIDTLTERLLAEAGSLPAGKTLQTVAKGHSAWAARISHTGWFIILASPVTKYPPTKK